MKVEEKDLSHKDREEGAKMKTWGNLGLMYLACCTNKKEGTSKKKFSIAVYEVQHLEKVLYIQTGEKIKQLNIINWSHK